MKLFQRKNNILGVTIVFVYVILYLYSPFIHSHSNSNGSISSHYYHTHLIDIESNDEFDYDHFSYQNEKHHHHIILNVLVTNPTPRFQKFISSIILYDVKNEDELGNELNTKKFIEVHLKTILPVDKCIHSASNVSPPNILTA
jgi:hypothetical protein